MRTIIITGANGNLGKAVTQKFITSGYKIIAIVGSDTNKQGMPEHALLDVRVVNLTNVDETNKFAEDVISQYSQVHGLIMLVGGFSMGNIETTTLADILKMFSLNFETAFNISKPLFKHFKDNGYGRLVFIGARPAIEAVDGKLMVAYGLSKSLLFKLAEYLNAEAKNINVSASVVVPSILDTVTNRVAMPDVNPNLWVNTDQLSEVLEFIVNPKS